MTRLQTLPRHETTVSKRLNIGCGGRFHCDWVNLDLQPVHPSIRHWDVARPLPFENGAFQVVYHSHLLEHLRQEQALPFLCECHRVLKRGGIVRVAVPDLEAMCRLYVQAVDRAWREDPEALERHRWLVMELYDQTTREETGGAMLPYLQSDGRGDSLAWYRIGQEGAVIRRHLQHLPPAPGTGLQARLKGWLLGSWRERLVRWLLGAEYPLLKIGRFRRRGEVHHWMYDRVALRDLLTQAGFVDFRCVGAKESAIPGWIDYHLDATPDGAVCKPDSLFVEASKP